MTLCQLLCGKYSLLISRLSTVFIYKSVFLKTHLKAILRGCSTILQCCKNWSHMEVNSSERLTLLSHDVLTPCGCQLAADNQTLPMRKICGYVRKGDSCLFGWTFTTLSARMENLLGIVGRSVRWMLRPGIG